jgi:helicase MOV-10
VVEDIRVGLQLANSLHYFPGQRYSVRFSLSRLPLRRMHQALDTAFFPPRVLFPKPLHRLISMRPTESHILSVRPVNRTIMGNAPQLLAVTSIINLPQGSPPFIIFGPYVLLTLQSRNSLMTRHCTDQALGKRLRLWRLSSKSFIAILTLKC